MASPLVASWQVTRALELSWHLTCAAWAQSEISQEAHQQRVLHLGCSSIAFATTANFASTAHQSLASA